MKQNLNVALRIVLCASLFTTSFPSWADNGKSTNQPVTTTPNGDPRSQTHNEESAAGFYGRRSLPSRYGGVTATTNEDPRSQTHNEESVPGLVGGQNIAAAYFGVPNGRPISPDEKINFIKLETDKAIPYDKALLPVYSPQGTEAKPLTRIPIMLKQNGTPNTKSILYQSLKSMFQTHSDDLIIPVEQPINGWMHPGTIQLTRQNRVDVVTAFLSQIAHTTHYEARDVSANFDAHNYIDDSEISAPSLAFLKKFFPSAAKKLDAMRTSYAESGLQAEAVSISGTGATIDFGMKSLASLVVLKEAYNELTSRNLLSDEERKLFAREADIQFAAAARSFTSVTSPAGFSPDDKPSAAAFNEKLAGFLRTSLFGDNVADQQNLLMHDAIARRFAEVQRLSSFFPKTAFRDRLTKRTFNVPWSDKLGWAFFEAMMALQNVDHLSTSGHIVFGLRILAIIVLGTVSYQTTLEAVAERGMNRQDARFIDAIMRGDRQDICATGVARISEP